MVWAFDPKMRLSLNYIICFDFFFAPFTFGMSGLPRKVDGFFSDRTRPDPTRLKSVSAVPL